MCLLWLCRSSCQLCFLLTNLFKAKESISQTGLSCSIQMTRIHTTHVHTCIQTSSITVLDAYSPANELSLWEFRHNPTQQVHCLKTICCTLWCQYGWGYTYMLYLRGKHVCIGDSRSCGLSSISISTSLVSPTQTRAPFSEETRKRSCLVHCTSSRCICFLH